MTSHSFMRLMPNAEKYKWPASSRERFANTNKQDAYSGVNSACRENRQELDIRLSIYSGRGKHA